jgi:hypothetical protein
MYTPFIIVVLAFCELMLVTIVLAIIVRCQVRPLAWFFAFCCAEALNTPLVYLVWLNGSRSKFYYTAWSAEAISVVLATGVIVTIFRQMFIGYEGIRRLAIVLFWVVVVALLVIAVATTPYGNQGLGYISQVTVVPERGLRMIQLGLILFIFAFSSYLGLTWKAQNFGIALGFGIFVIADMLALAVSAEYGPHADHIVNTARIAIDGVITVIWATYLLRSKYRPPDSTPQSDELDKWNGALLRFLGRK